MSSVRRAFTPTGEVLLAQCEGCKTYVEVDGASFRGETILRSHAEWRPTILHLFAQGRPWLLQDSLRARLWRWAIRRYLDAKVLPVTCRWTVPYNYAQDWPTTGLSAFTPKAQPDGWAPELTTRTT